MSTTTTMATAGAIGSAAASIGSAWAQSSSFKIQEMQAKTAAMWAKVQGSADALTLTNIYNTSAGQDAVMSAAQGRSGGSVSGIASAAKSQLDWDTAFNAISTEVRLSGFKSQAEQYSIASNGALYGGIALGVASGAEKIGTSLYSIGGSTKKKEDRTLYEGGAEW